MIFRIGPTDSKYVPGVWAAVGFTRSRDRRHAGRLHAGLGYSRGLPAHAREELEWEARVEARLARGLPTVYGALAGRTA